MSLYYKSAQQVRVIPFIIGILLATIGSLALTAIAALLGLWLGRPYVGIFLVAVVALLSAFLYRGMFIKTKTTNRLVAHSSVLFSSLLVAYYHMNVVTAAVTTIGPYLDNAAPTMYLQNVGDILFRNIFTSALRPDLAAPFFRPVYVFGSFLTSGVAWVAYLVIILVSVATLPQLSVNVVTQPFDKERQQWMKKVYSVGRVRYFLPEEKELLRSQLEEGNTNPLLERSRVTRYNADKYAKLFFYKTGSQHSGYFGVDNISHKYSKAGELLVDQLKTEPFFPPILVGESKARELEATLNSSAMMSFGMEDSILNTTFTKVSDEKKDNR